MKNALVPTNIGEAMALADALAKSTIIPKEYQGAPGNVLVAIQWGMELGLHPLQAMQSIAVVNGRPALYGDAMLAVVKGSGLLESISEESTNDRAACTVKRKGENEVARVFTAEDAKKAGLLGKAGPWTQYPRRMMQMRARAFALRDVFPDVLRGIYSAEESQDIIDVEAEVIKDANIEDKKANRTGAIRNMLAEKRADTAGLTHISHITSKMPEPSVRSILDNIESATTIEELGTVIERAAKIPEGEGKARLRSAYADKLAKLKAAERAEHPAEPSVTYAQIADMLMKANDPDSMAIAADMIRYAQPDQREELTDIYKARIAEMVHSKQVDDDDDDWPKLPTLTPEEN